MSKSSFSTWSLLTRKALAAHRCKLSHGQSMEVIAAGLGHNTYASFRSQDESAIEQAKFIVLSFDAMQQRASGLGVQISAEQCQSVLARINEDFDEDPMSWLMQSLDRTDAVPRQSVDFSEIPEVVDLAALEGFKFDGVTILWGECLHAFPAISESWRWRINGLVHASARPDDFEIPFIANVQFSKCGRHFFTKARVLDVSPTGRPSLVDDGNFDGYVSDSDD